MSAFINYSQRHVVIKKLPLVRYGEDATRVPRSNAKPVLMVLVIGETAGQKALVLTATRVILRLS